MLLVGKAALAAQALRSPLCHGQLRHAQASAAAAGGNIDVMVHHYIYILDYRIHTSLLTHECYCTFARYETVEGEAGPGCELAEQ
eukprot:COSAG06_NODE_10498_length_1667_cov_2.050286_1_plen_84_part_10